MSWQTPGEAAFLSVSRKAMKDEFEVVFSRLDFPQGTEAAMDALDEVERLEKVLSVFRFDSRVKYINLAAHEDPVKLDRELFDLIAMCLEMAEATGGAVDITCGPFWRIWGFARRENRIPSELEIESARDVVGYRLVELDPEAKTIRFKKQGVELNFGCVGKGFALDVGARKLREQELDRFLFRGGLSSFLAEGKDWMIGVAHPMRHGQRLAELTLDGEAVGTSGSDKQFFRYNGHRYSHLIDPRTGRPAEGVLSVTVLAPNGTLAELLSTAFFVLGPEKTEAYCTEHPEIAVLMTLPISRRAGFEVRHWGFQEVGQEKSTHADRLRFVADDFA